MASVHDVAAYILNKQGEMPAMKLQKLIYYCQAWSLVWDEEPMFPERIEAWVNGPVAPDLYSRHRGMFKVLNWNDGNALNLTSDQTATIDAVLGYYGGKPSQWLSDLTHAEKPWMDARAGLAATERGNVVISHDAMAQYYGAL